MKPWIRACFFQTLLLTTAIRFTDCSLSTGPPSADTSSSTLVQTFLGSGVPDMAEVVFQGKTHLAFSRDLLESFFQCLCDKRTSDCYLTYTSGRSPNNYLVIRVDSLQDLPASGTGQSAIRQDFAGYICQSPDPISNKNNTLPCKKMGNSSANQPDSTSVAQRYHNSCDFKCIRLQWSTTIQYAGFGRGHSGEARGFCVPSADDPKLDNGYDEIEVNVNKNTGFNMTENQTSATTTGVISNNNSIEIDVESNDTIAIGADTTSNENTSNESKEDQHTEKSNSVKDECDCGVGLCILGISLSISVIVNFALLVICAYLWIGIKRKRKGQLSQLDDKLSQPVRVNSQPQGQDPERVHFRGADNLVYVTVNDFDNTTTKKLETIPDAREDSPRCSADGASDEHSYRKDTVGSNATSDTSPTCATPAAPVFGGVFVGFSQNAARAIKLQPLRAESEKSYIKANDVPDNPYYIEGGETIHKTPFSAKTETKYSYRPKLKTPLEEDIKGRDLANEKTPSSQRDTSSNEAGFDDIEEYKNLKFPVGSDLTLPSHNDKTRVKPQPRKPRRGTRKGSECSDSSQSTEDPTPMSNQIQLMQQSGDSENTYEVIAALSRHEGHVRSNSQNSNKRNVISDDSSEEEKEIPSIYANMVTMTKRPWF